MLKSISYITILSIALFFSSCDSGVEKMEPIYRDFDTIQQEGTLTALINYGSTSYFIYKGVPQGFEYELLRMYSDKIGVNLKVVPIQSIDNVFIQLNKGEADVVAANLTVTEERLEQVSFTHPILITKQVLIQRKPDDWRKMKKKQVEDSLLRSIMELGGKNIVVRENSSFYKELKKVSKDIKQKIHRSSIISMR